MIWRVPTAIEVAPAAIGWAVSWAGCGGPLMFLSGARAEAEASRLAARLAGAGYAVEVRVHDRQGVLVGAIRHTPPEPLRTAAFSRRAPERETFRAQNFQAGCPPRGDEVNSAA